MSVFAEEHFRLRRRVSSGEPTRLLKLLLFSEYGHHKRFYWHVCALRKNCPPRDKLTFWSRKTLLRWVFKIPRGLLNTGYKGFCTLQR